jgi:hypothetical protein
MAELEYYLLFLSREGLVEPSKSEQLQAMQQEAARVLYGLWKSLKQKSKDGTWDRTGARSAAQEAQ